MDKNKLYKKLNPYTSFSLLYIITPKEKQTCLPYQWKL